MPKINYQQARQTLSLTFERYLVHNKTQLDALQRTSPISPPEGFFTRAAADFSGFLGWISCYYAEIMDNIIGLNGSESGGFFDYYEKNYPPCESKTIFFPHSIERLRIGLHPIYEYPDVDPILVLDRLTVLVGLFHYVMIEENRVPDFEKNLEVYQSKNANNSLILESDPDSIKIYKTLKKLKELACFVNETLPKYKLFGIDGMVRNFEKSLSTFEGYIKNIAVRELKSTLDNPELSDEDSVKVLAAQLQNEEILDVLEKNRQSQTEHILKVISVALIAVGIGIIPTVFLAAKRLYDSGGTSINFFKPLSINLCEDVSGITAEVEQDLKIS